MVIVWQSIFYWKKKTPTFSPKHSILKDKRTAFFHNKTIASNYNFWNDDEKAILLKIAIIHSLYFF